jgi:hypothetical protein
LWAWWQNSGMTSPLKTCNMCLNNGLRVLSRSLQMKENSSSRKSRFQLNYSTDLGIGQAAKTFWTPHIMRGAQGKQQSRRAKIGKCRSRWTDCFIIRRLLTVSDLFCPFFLRATGRGCVMISHTDGLFGIVSPIIISIVKVVHRSWTGVYQALTLSPCTTLL